MPKPQLSDADIILRLRSGNARQEAEAVRYVQKHFRGLIFNLVRKLGGDFTQDVPDVLNDATAITVKQVQSGAFQPGETKLSTYFHAVAENILKNILRERRRRRETPMAGMPVEKPVLFLSDAEKAINAMEAGKQVAAAIRKLDEPCRQILEQYWLKDRSMRDIGADMGKTEGAVKKIHQRCKKRLRILLGETLKDLFND